MTNSNNSPELGRTRICFHESEGETHDANLASSEHLEMMAAELGALYTEYKRNAVLELQRKVQLWAIRYSKLPRVCRPVCLHYFKKYAKKYNGLVCFLFPPVEGAPLPIEELVNIEI